MSSAPIVVKNFLDVDYVKDLVRKKYPNCQVQMVESCSFICDDLNYKDLFVGMFSGKFIYCGYVSCSSVRHKDYSMSDLLDKGAVECVQPTLLCNGTMFLPSIGSYVPVIFDNLKTYSAVGFSFSFIGFRVYIEGKIDNFSVASFDKLVDFNAGDIVSGLFVGAGNGRCGVQVFAPTGFQQNGLVPFVVKNKFTYDLVVPWSAGEAKHIFDCDAIDLKLLFVNQGILPIGIKVANLYSAVYWGSDHFSFELDVSLDDCTLTAGNKTISYVKGDRLVSFTYAEYGYGFHDPNKPLDSVTISVGGDPSFLVDGLTYFMSEVLLDKFVFNRL